jgi:hypothetical protein
MLASASKFCPAVTLADINSIAPNITEGVKIEVAATTAKHTERIMTSVNHNLQATFRPVVGNLRKLRTGTRRR